MGIGFEDRIKDVRCRIAKAVGVEDGIKELLAGILGSRDEKILKNQLRGLESLGLGEDVEDYRVSV